MVENERLAFMAQWLDAVSGVLWTYQLMVYPQTSEVELFDVKNRRTFLRKSKLEGLKAHLFFVGAVTTVFGRQLKIVDYGDEYTRKALEAAQQRCDAAAWWVGVSWCARTQWNCLHHEVLAPLHKLRSGLWQLSSQVLLRTRETSCRRSRRLAS